MGFIVYVVLAILSMQLSMILAGCAIQPDSNGHVNIPNDPKGWTSIGNDAFSSCTSLRSVTIGDSVTSIGNGAFSRTSLGSVIIPDNVTSIGDSAFYSCTSLKSVTIGDLSLIHI